MTTLAEKMKRYPYHTVYGGTGEHLILIWYEYDKGHNAIVTRTMEQMIALWKRAFAKEPMAETRHFWRANIVSHPQRVAELYAEQRYDSDMDTFQYRVGEWALLADKINRLPEWIRLCTEFSRTLEASEDTVSDWGREQHYECLNCQHRMVLHGVTWDDMLCRTRGVVEAIDQANYAFERKTKEKAIKGKLKAEKLAIVMEARRVVPADPSLPLHVAICNAGHHQNGFRVVPVDLDEDPYFDKAGFFFHGQSEPIPPELTGYVKPPAKSEVDIRWAAEAEAAQQAIKDRQQAEQAVQYLQRLYAEVENDS